MAARPEDIRSAFGGAAVRIVRDSSLAATGWNRSDDLQSTENRKEYSSQLLLLAMLVFVIETLLANFFTRRRSVQPAPTVEYMGTRRFERALAARR